MYLGRLPARKRQDGGLWIRGSREWTRAILPCSDTASEEGRTDRQAECEEPAAMTAGKQGESCPAVARGLTLQTAEKSAGKWREGKRMIKS